MTPPHDAAGQNEAGFADAPLLRPERNEFFIFIHLYSPNVTAETTGPRCLGPMVLLTRDLSSNRVVGASLRQL